MTRYTFSEPKKYDIVWDKVYLYYDEESHMETNTWEDEETGETYTDTHQVWTYQRAEMHTPLDYSKVVDALVRKKYSQDAVEAIFRHKLAGTDEENEFDGLNTYAEWCKLEAKRICE